MDERTRTTVLPFALQTPLYIGVVALNVRDLERTGSYYRDLLGLSEIDRTADMVRLGAGGTTLLELVHRPDMLPDDPSTAGLFHTAFLMPTRADLARWVMHIAQARMPITGASDHGVSEAFYLDDPEGNGIEVYADRPPELWAWSDGVVSMPTDRLDVEKLVTETGAQDSGYAGAPAGLRIGHVHLRVGDLDRGEAFYRGGIGLDLTRRRQGAAFMSSGGYHHHVGSNVWRSAGAGPRDENRAGLAWFSFVPRDAATERAVKERLAASGATVVARDGATETTDPWGTRVRLMAG
jgi:catechol 2,3-dioxygenase